MKQIIITLADSADGELAESLCHEEIEFFLTEGRGLRVEKVEYRDSSKSAEDDGLGGETQWTLGDTYRLTLLETLVEYSTVARNMKNALAYWYGRPDSLILVLKDEVATCLAAVEIEPSTRRVLQIQGPRNTHVDPALRTLLDDWLTSKGYTVLPPGMKEDAPRARDLHKN